MVLTGAEGAPRDRDFGELDRQPTIGVVEGEGRFGHAGRGPALATTENDVFVFLARRACCPCSPSTQRTASATFDLPLPFGPTIAGDARLEREDGAVEETLETLDFEAGQTGSAKQGLVVGHRGGAPGNDYGVGTGCACPAQVGWYHRPPGPDNEAGRPSEEARE